MSTLNINGGDLKFNTLQGSDQAFGLIPSVIAFPSDANYTLSAAQQKTPYLRLAGGTTLTATRNVVLTLADGLLYLVYNNSPGGQSVQFIGATGTGATVATGKWAWIACDGTNWYTVPN